MIFAVVYCLIREVALQTVKCELTDFAKFGWKLHKYSSNSKLQIQKYPRTNKNTIRLNLTVFATFNGNCTKFTNNTISNQYINTNMFKRLSQFVLETGQILTHFKSHFAAKIKVLATLHSNGSPTCVLAGLQIVWPNLLGSNNVIANICFWCFYPIFATEFEAILNNLSQFLQHL